jgi:hypothetical protein
MFTQLNAEGIYEGFGVFMEMMKIFSRYIFQFGTIRLDEVYVWIVTFRLSRNVEITFRSRIIAYSCNVSPIAPIAMYVIID